jgi:ribonuclease inhibitor
LTTTSPARPTERRSHARRIQGSEIHVERDLHRALARKLEFGTDGWNMAALRERLLNDVERPIHLVWQDSEKSRSNLGKAFAKVVAIFQEAKGQDEHYGWKDRFSYELR